MSLCKQIKTRFLLFSRMAYQIGARPKLVPNKCVAKKSTSKQCLQSYQDAKTTEYFQALSDSETDSSESEGEIMIVEDAIKSGETFFS